jgi:hypothetical protein
MISFKINHINKSLQQSCILEREFVTEQIQ